MKKWYDEEYEFEIEGTAETAKRWVISIPAPMAVP